MAMFNSYVKLAEGNGIWRAFNLWSFTIAMDNDQF